MTNCNCSLHFVLLAYSLLFLVFKSLKKTTYIGYFSTCLYELASIANNMFLGGYYIQEMHDLHIVLISKYILSNQYIKLRCLFCFVCLFVKVRSLEPCLFHLCSWSCQKASMRRVAWTLFYDVPIYNKKMKY